MRSSWTALFAFVSLAHAVNFCALSNTCPGEGLLDDGETCGTDAQCSSGLCNGTYNTCGQLPVNSPCYGVNSIGQYVTECQAGSSCTISASPFLHPTSGYCKADAAPPPTTCASSGDGSVTYGNPCMTTSQCCQVQGPSQCSTGACRSCIAVSKYCTDSNQCCNGSQCTAGGQFGNQCTTCPGPGAVQDGGTCQSANDCCNGYCTLSKKCGRPKLGQSCTGDAIYDCESGATCGFTASGQQICLVSNNRPCQTSDQCFSRYCSGVLNTCQSAITKSGLQGDCATSADCTGSLTCSNGQCRANLGSSCSGPGDCSSGLCAQGICSQPCSLDSDCASDAFCTIDKKCQLKIADGGSCVAFQPQSCISGVCPAFSAKCGTLADGQQCSVSADCTSSHCNSQSKCGTVGIGNFCDSDQDCSRGTCQGERCKASCSVQTDCLAVETCQGGQCLNAAGISCSNPGQYNGACQDTLCNSGSTCGYIPGGGMCQSSNECAHNDMGMSTATCSSGTCLGFDGSTCDSNSQCASGSCNGVGKCGLQSLQSACSSTADCQSGLLCQEGTCLSPNGAQCNPNALNPGSTCASGLCGSQTSTCTSQPLPDGSACTSADGCTKGYCNSQGYCGGIANSKACSIDYECFSGQCQTSSTGTGKVCVGLADGSDCISAIQCRTPICNGQSKCGLQKAFDFCSTSADCSQSPIATTCFSGACFYSNGATCSADGYCASQFCSPNTGLCRDAPTGQTVNGSACVDNGDCASTSCSAGLCKALVAPSQAKRKRDALKRRQKRKAKAAARGRLAKMKMAAL